MKRKASEDATAWTDEEVDDVITRPAKVGKKLLQNQHVVLNWLRKHYVLGTSGSTPKAELFDEYLNMCIREGVEPTSNSAFGKLVRIAFPGIQSSRKGPRGAAKHQYKFLQRREAGEQDEESEAEEGEAGDGQDDVSYAQQLAAQQEYERPRTRRMTSGSAMIAHQTENAESESEKSDDEDYVDEEYTEETLEVGSSASPMLSPQRSTTQRRERSRSQNEGESAFYFSAAPSSSSPSSPHSWHATPSSLGSEADCGEPLSSSPLHAAYAYRPAPSTSTTCSSPATEELPQPSFEVIDQGSSVYYAQPYSQHGPFFYQHIHPLQLQRRSSIVDHSLAHYAAVDQSSFETYPTAYFAQQGAWEGDDVQALLTLTQEVDEFGLLHRADAREEVLMWQTESTPCGTSSRGDDWIDQLLLGGCN